MSAPPRSPLWYASITSTHASSPSFFPAQNMRPTSPLSFYCTTIYSSIVGRHYYTYHEQPASVNFSSNRNSWCVFCCHFLFMNNFFFFYYNCSLHTYTWPFYSFTHGKILHTKRVYIKRREKTDRTLSSVSVHDLAIC